MDEAASGVWVSGLSYELGSASADLATSDEQGRFLTAPDELARAGFALHHPASPGESAYDLALRVGRRAAMAAPLDPDALVYATALPSSSNAGSEEEYRATRDVKHLMDFPASRLCADLGWDRASVFGLSQQACTGVLGAWRVGSALLSLEPSWTEVVCVSADRFPTDALYEQAYSPISDAATLSRLTSHPVPRGFRLVSVHQVTNGALSFADDAETVGSFFPWMHRTVTGALGRAGWQLGEVDWVVPQNTHRSTWEVLSRLLHLGSARVHCPTLPRVGHMVAGDNLANLVDLEASGLLRQGDRVLVAAAGYGANYQCALLQAGPR